MRSNLKFLSAYSVVNLFLVLTQFGSLSLGLSPPTTAFLIYTQPIWTIIFGRIFFKERVTFVGLGVIALALLGLLLITNPFSESALELNSRYVLAEFIAIAGGVALSIWIILGKKGRLDQLKEPVSLTFAVRTFSIIPIGIVSFGVFRLFGSKLFLGQQDFSPSILYLVLFAIFAGALPDYLFYRGVEKVSAIQAGVVLLLEPVSAAVISVALRISVVSWPEILGGALILISNYLVIMQSRRTEAYGLEGSVSPPESR